MSDISVYGINSPQDAFTESILSSQSGLCPDYSEFLPYTGGVFAGESFQSELLVQTTIPMPALKHPVDDELSESQQCQRGCMYPSPGHILQFHKGHPSYVRNTLWIGTSDLTSLHPPSTYDSPTEWNVVSSRSAWNSSFSSPQSLTEHPNIQALEDVVIHSPPVATGLVAEQYWLPTIIERVQKLSPSSLHLFKNCGSDPFTQSAVLDILESPQIQMNARITSEMAAPLLEKIPYTSKMNGKGKRGAPQFYKCCWGSCREKMSRKLHALEHIMNHVNNRSHVCDHCGKGFVRKNELKKHSPCKVLKKRRSCIDRGLGSTLVHRFGHPAFPGSSNSGTEIQLTSGCYQPPLHSKNAGFSYQLADPTYSAPRMSGTTEPHDALYSTSTPFSGSWKVQ